MDGKGEKKNEAFFWENRRRGAGALREKKETKKGKRKKGWGGRAISKKGNMLGKNHSAVVGGKEKKHRGFGGKNWDGGMALDLSKKGERKKKRHGQRHFFEKINQSWETGEDWGKGGRPWGKRGRTHPGGGRAEKYILHMERDHY